MNPGRRRATIGVDRRDHQLTIDQADVEARLPAHIDVVTRSVGAGRNHREMRELKPAEHVREHGAELAGRPSSERGGAQLGAETVPCRDVERGIEVAILDDLQDGVERLRRLERLGRRRARPEQDREQHGRRQAAEGHRAFT